MIFKGDKKVKAKNLKILMQNGINVPHFIVLNANEELTTPTLFALSNDKKYAVRSSFAGEDSAQNSFAGQFDTLLNVPKKELKTAVKTVQKSFQNKNVTKYSDIKGVSTSSEGQVIIQEMIDADYSGVIFTANPIGILNETVIVVGKGLGCNVVEDKINTTAYYYNQDDDIYYYEQQEDSPLLKESIIKELIDLSEKIKNIFNFEADIEFAIKQDVVYILQARSITTLNFENPIVLDNSNIVESYPGVSAPLTQDFVKSVYHDIFYNCVMRVTKNKKLTNAMDIYLKDMVESANGRIYYRISSWYAVLKLLPFSNKIISIWQKMLGVTNKNIVYPTNIPVRIKDKFTILKSVIHYLRKTPQYMDDLNKRFEADFKKYKNRVEEADTIEELLDVYEKIKNGILTDWDITLVNDMYTFIYTALAGEKNKEYISNIKNLESMKPAFGIKDLVTIANENGLNSDIYKWHAQKYIENFGDRCLGELKLETETYRTNPELLEKYIISQMQTDFKNLTRSKDNFTPNNRFVKKAKIGIKNREISRMNRSRLYGLSREIFRKIGKILNKQNKINKIEDVFYLHINELTLENVDFKELINKRKIEKEIYEKIPAYSRLVFEKKVINKQLPILCSNILNKTDTLSGIATSTGEITAEVLVIEEPNDTIDTTGKILVTKTTDPGWIFLIQNAVGIIAEKGSLLSHTAIISRELNKPAIVNVKDCTKILKNNDFVLLNANDGTIKIIERG